MDARDLFSGCLAYSWMVSSAFIAFPGDLPYSKGLGVSAVSLGRASKLVPLTILNFGLLYLWNQEVHAVAAGTALLVMAFGVRQWEKSLWPGDIVVELGKYVPAEACLLGYTVAYAATADADPTRVGWEGAAGVMGAIFAINGVSKFQEGGVQWFRSTGLGLLVLERAYTTQVPVLRRLRLALARKPLWCTTLSSAVVLTELLAFLFWVPILRWPFALALCTALVGFGVFLGHFHLLWPALLVALAWAAG